MVWLCDDVGEASCECDNNSVDENCDDTEALCESIDRDAVTDASGECDSEQLTLSREVADSLIDGMEEADTDMDADDDGDDALDHDVVPDTLDDDESLGDGEDVRVDDSLSLVDALSVCDMLAQKVTDDCTLKEPVRVGMEASADNDIVVDTLAEHVGLYMRPVDRHMVQIGQGTGALTLKGQ